MKARLPLLLAAALLAGGLFTPGCTLAQPFRAGSIAAEELPPETPVQVALTHARLISSERAVFDDFTQAISGSLAQQEGLLGYTLRKEPFGDEVWTMSVWLDEASMWRFVRSELHRDAMANAADAVDEMRSGVFELQAGDVPLSWSEGLELLDAQGPLPD